MTCFFVGTGLGTYYGSSADASISDLLLGRLSSRPVPSRVAGLSEPVGVSSGRASEACLGFVGGARTP